MVANDDSRITIHKAVSLAFIARTEGRVDWLATSGLCAPHAWTGLKQLIPQVRRSYMAALAALVATTACIPYTVGHTAQPVPNGESVLTTSYYVVPNAATLRDSVSQTLFGMDTEYRSGIADNADVGMRFVSGSGLVVNYKRRVSGDNDPDAAALSWMLGAGLVNFFQHLHFEGSLLASSARRGNLVTYGGLRIMQVAPISAGAAHDTPTAGGFIGLRVGSPNDAVLPELAVYRDHSALGLRSSNIILVPSISVRGDLLHRILRPF